MLSIKNIIPVTKVKRDLLKLLSQVQSTGDPVIITKDGKAAGILMNSIDYEELMETFEILSDKELIKSLKSSEKDFKKGRYFTHEEIFGDE